MSNAQLIQMRIEGDKAVMRELRTAATRALPPGVVKSIFVKAMQNMTKEAKRNARTIQTGGDQKSKSGRVISRYTKKGQIKSRYRHRAGRDLAKAIKTKKYKGRYARGVNLSILQKELPTISKTTGKPYKAFGRTGVPIAQWLEVGTKNRQKRGRIRGGHPIWKAFKTWERYTQDRAIKLIMERLGKDINQSNYRYIKFIKAG